MFKLGCCSFSLGCNSFCSLNSEQELTWSKGEGEAVSSHHSWLIPALLCIMSFPYGAISSTPSPFESFFLAKEKSLKS